MIENKDIGSEQPFISWVTDKLISKRTEYNDHKYSDDPRKGDILLGEMRAYRNAKEEYLKRNRDTENDQ